jgi:hypothetical protein
MISGIIDSNQKIVSSGLIFNVDAAQRRSYPTTGTTWTDLSGNGKDGILINGAAYDSANGGTIQLDGTNDYINISPIVNLSNVSQFTFSSFVKINSVNVKALFSYGVGSSFSNDILIFFNISPSLLFIQVNNGADGSATIPYTNLSTYANICVVYDGSLSTNADKLKLYINGSLSTLTFDSLYSVPTTTANVTSAECRIGSYVATNGFFLSGNIATASIYNRALTSTEVGQNFNAIKSRFGL